MCYFANTDRLFFPPFDRELSSDGNMPVDVFERIAADLFPKAWRVALGCAAEPMIHPKFKELVAIAGRYGDPGPLVPDEPPRADRRDGGGPRPRARGHGRGVDRRHDEGHLREDPRAREMGAPPRLPRHAFPCSQGRALEDAEAADHLHVDAVEPEGPAAAARVRRGSRRDRDRRAVRVARRPAST